MFTPSHIIINLATLGRSRTKLYPAIIWGALIPDLPIAFVFLWEGIIRVTPWETITSVSYYQPGWQNFIDTFNSIPFALALLALGIYKKWKPLTYLSGSILLHIALDFPFHTEDAHRHFFPFSNFRYHSAVSYWNPAENGLIMHIIELTLVVIASLRIWPFLKTIWSKSLILLTHLVYIVSILFLAFPADQQDSQPDSLESPGITEPQSSPQSESRLQSAHPPSP